LRYSKRTIGSMPAKASSRSTRHAPSDGQDLGPRAEQWPDLLDELNVRFLVLDANRDAGLLQLFQAHPGWAIDLQDDRSVLLVRSDAHVSAASSSGE
jgi:hypothetical protein